MSMKYRLGLDVGTNSIGWAMLALDDEHRPTQIFRAGVRIFTDGRSPQDGSSNAVERRMARQMRRQRDRSLVRQQRVMNALVRHGVLPESSDARKALRSLDPYVLRSRGLDEALTLPEFGRALLHLSKRRGFRSSRKDANKNTEEAKESKKIASAAQELRDLLTKHNCRTVGEYLALRHKNKQSVRVRLQGSGAKARYDYYPVRKMVLCEFEQLWDAQKKHHPDVLTDAARQDVHDKIFFQRPLKPVPVGKCTLDPTEERAPKASMVFQEFRLLQDLNHLQVIDASGEKHALGAVERARVLHELLRKKEVTFTRVRKLLELDADHGFNLEHERKKALQGHVINSRLADKKAFGKAWHTLDAETQVEIVQALHEADNEEDIKGLRARLMKEHGLTQDAADKVLSTTLPEGHGQLSVKAMSNILPFLREGQIYANAVGASEYKTHSDFRPGQVLDALPYYGKVLERHVGFGSGELDRRDEERYGKIANPTVHIVLNQLRRMVNLLIERYGHPTQIAVELSRDLKLSAKRKEDIQKQQKKHQDANDKRKQKLKEHDIEVNYAHLLKMRLWEELNPKACLGRCCPYTGKPISFEELFSKNSAVEIEHILPYAATLDDSPANKTVCFRDANRDKAKRSPYDAFGSQPEWPNILARANQFPKNKRWRFAPDAMEKFKKENGFLARQLTDTQYIARVACEYLRHICEPNHVWSNPGRLTSKVRHHWGLNSLLGDGDTKDRSDHRHHAIDAIVVAAMDRSLLTHIAQSLAGDKVEAKFAVHLARAMESATKLAKTNDDLRTHVQDALASIVVSHRVDHGIAGAMHKETAYRVIGEPDAKGYSRVAVRVPLDITAFKTLADLDNICDPQLAERIRRHILRTVKADHAPTHALPPATDIKLTKEELTKGLDSFRDHAGVRRVRVKKGKIKHPIVIRDKEGRPYKAFDAQSNHAYDIYQLPGEDKWRGEIIRTFDIHQPGYQPAWLQAHPAAKRIMRLHKNDTVLVDFGSERLPCLIQKMSQGRITFHPCHRAVKSSTNPSGIPAITKSPNGLRKLHAKLLYVDPLGTLRGGLPDARST